jgi:HK97 family phage major capsid protein
MSGVLGWSAVVQSGAQLLGPLKDDCRLFHDSNLPSATWNAEIAAVVPADVNFVGTTLSAKRITASIVISRQLLLQTGSISLGQSGASMSLDQYLSAKMKLAFASVLDQSALYGSGPGNNDPLGVLNTCGTQNLPMASPPTWSDIANATLPDYRPGPRSKFVWLDR